MHIFSNGMVRWWWRNLHKISNEERDKFHIIFHSPHSNISSASATRGSKCKISKNIETILKLQRCTLKYKYCNENNITFGLRVAESREQRNFIYHTLAQQYAFLCVGALMQKKKFQSQPCDIKHYYCMWLFLYQVYFSPKWTRSF